MDRCDYTQELIAILNLAVREWVWRLSLPIKETNLPHALSHPLHLEVLPRYQLYSLSIERYLTIDILGRFGKYYRVFGLYLFQLMGWAKMSNLNYILVWLCHWGHFQCSCGLWSGDSTTTVNSNISSKSWHYQHLLELSLPQTMPRVKVRCLHRLRGVIYHYESVPPMPPGVPTRNPGVPVCHMAQELYVMLDLYVLLFMWWPRGCGWNSRLSLQSIDYPCSLRLHCVCKNFTKY